VKISEAQPQRGDYWATFHFRVFPLSDVTSFLTWDVSVQVCSYTCWMLPEHPSELYPYKLEQEVAEPSVYLLGSSSRRLLQ